MEIQINVTRIITSSLAASYILLREKIGGKGKNWTETSNSILIKIFQLSWFSHFQSSQSWKKLGFDQESISNRIMGFKGFNVWKEVLESPNVILNCVQDFLFLNILFFDTLYVTKLTLLTKKSFEICFTAITYWTVISRNALGTILTWVFRGARIGRS